MPELPEIETVRRVVGPQIVGHRVASVSVRHPKVIGSPDPDRFVQRLTGRRFTDLTRRGKILTAQLDDGERMVMHMRMTGCLVVSPHDRPEDPHTHIVVRLDDGMELRFSDTRRFGRFWLLAEGEDDDCTGLSKLGPEPFDPSFTAEYLEGRIGSSRRAIKECLLDQSVVAGIGNIYSDEILFATGIDPACPANLLGHGDWTRLADEIPRTLEFFVEKNEISAEDWLEGRGREYRNTPYIRIYAHGGEPCPVCGTTLVRRVIGGRSSVSCPSCQRSADADCIAPSVEPGCAVSVSRIEK